jgi:hypothetical protein
MLKNLLLLLLSSIISISCRHCTLIGGMDCTHTHLSIFVSLAH